MISADVLVVSLKLGHAKAPSITVYLRFVSAQKGTAVKEASSDLRMCSLGICSFTSWEVGLWALGSALCFESTVNVASLLNV